MAQERPHLDPATGPTGSPVVETIVAPAVAPIVAPAAGGLGTLGGDLVVITGTNFGPLQGRESPLVTASYTNHVDGVAYNATNCTVAPGGNTMITCRTAPGVGSDHLWTIQVRLMLLLLFIYFLMMRML